MLQFEGEFLARVRVQTSVDLLTATGPVVYLFRQNSLLGKPDEWL